MRILPVRALTLLDQSRYATTGYIGPSQRRVGPIVFSVGPHYTSNMSLFTSALKDSHPVSVGRCQEVFRPKKASDGSPVRLEAGAGAKPTHRLEQPVSDAVHSRHVPVAPVLPVLEGMADDHGHGTPEVRRVERS